jgi:hypothetical protein
MAVSIQKLPLSELKGFLWGIVLLEEPRGIFADWLEENGDERADKVRLLRPEVGPAALVQMFPETWAYVEWGGVHIPGEIFQGTALEKVRFYARARISAHSKLDGMVRDGQIYVDPVGEFRFFGNERKEIIDLARKWVLAFVRVKSQLGTDAAR